MTGRDSCISCFSGRDRAWHDAVLDACPSLVSGCVPPRWARNRHVQTLLTVVRDARAPEVRWDRHDRLIAPDGGTVSVQWAGLDAPEGTPVLVALHTICGSGDGLRRLIATLRAELGWVVAACNRRGHADLPLTAPNVNTMGSTDDLRMQLRAIETERPGAPLYAVGVSAGSGLLVRYLGEEAQSSRIRASVAVCPAYDIPDAFRFMDTRYDAYMTRKVVEFFLRRNVEQLGAIDGFARCSAARSLAEFHERLYALAGFDSPKSYYAGSNPMTVATNIVTPTLVINSADDPVCAEANVHRNLESMQTLPRMTLAFTRFGSHCGFFEGPRAGRNWLATAIADYLRAAHRLLPTARVETAAPARR